MTEERDIETAVILQVCGLLTAALATKCQGNDSQGLTPYRLGSFVRQVFAERLDDFYCDNPEALEAMAHELTAGLAGEPNPTHKEKKKCRVLTLVNNEKLH